MGNGGSNDVPGNGASERTSALVSAEALLAEMDDDTPPLLLDVRWTLAGPDRAAYLSGHLPGAVFCDLDSDLAAPPGNGGRHPLPSAGSMTATMRRLGVGPRRRVVVYDGGASQPASRAWWCLRWAGHADTRVLDGGMGAWVAAGGAVEGGEVTPVPAPEAEAHVGAMPVVTADAVSEGTAGVLVDVRAAERFRGEVEPVDPVAGHIPGATSCPVTSLVTADGRYLPPSELRAVLSGLLDQTERLVAYCGSGVSATQLVLVCHEVGVEAALYPGSWSEWITDPARPIATGS